MPDTYFPGPDKDWAQKTPTEVGIDPDLLQQSIDYATDPAHAGSPPDLATHLLAQNGGKQHDDGRTLGPTKTHGRTTGVVLRHGYRIAEWGDPERVDMTFSISKSFLSTTCGLAYDKGLIKDLDDPVGNTIQDGGYDSPHNAQITWDHSLRQITEWDGTLWDKHHAAGNPDDELRTPQQPGTHYEYNDVRVNRFALSLLHLYGEPLPDILKREVMDPIQTSQPQ